MMFKNQEEEQPSVTAGNHVSQKKTNQKKPHSQTGYSVICHVYCHCFDELSCRKVIPGLKVHYEFSGKKLKQKEKSLIHLHE